MFVVSTIGNSNLAFCTFIFHHNSHHTSQWIKMPVPCGQNTQDLALAFEVLGSKTLDLDTLHLKVKPRNKII
jgi:hypothetical protein